MSELTKKMHDAVSLIEKQFGEGMAFVVDEGLHIKIETIPTGISVIDTAIGAGGIPRGRITEIWGAEATGKTTLCFHTIAQAQKMGLGCAFIDVEHSANFERMRIAGVDTTQIVFSQPDSGETALDLVDMMIRSGKFGLICIDSVAALTPQIELDKDMGESVMGVHARLMSQAMRKLTGPASKFKVAVVFTNQTRAKIGGYGMAETTTGGNALKFYASLRLKMQYIGQIKNTEGQRVSGKYKMTVVKNKLATPFKEAFFEINENGIDEGGGFIDQLVGAGILEKSGSFFKMDGETLAQGKRALSELLKEDRELKDRLTDRLAGQEVI